MLLLAPCAGILYLAFNGGGFFPGATGILAVVTAAALVIRIVTIRDPFAGIGRWAATILAVLVAYAVWVLLSGTWSDAPARAVLEFSRAVLYVLAFTLAASVPRTRTTLRLLVIGVAAGIVAVCTVALVTRVLPDVWPIDSNVQNDRLSYPITYWNVLGMLGALGIVLCLHISSSAREPVALRLIAAGAIPALVVTIFFTFSRGAVAAGALAVVIYLALGRPRGGLGTLLATVPPAVGAVVVAYGAELLATELPTGPAAVEQGHDVALAVAICVVGAALLRLILFELDVRIGALRPNLHLSRGVRGGLLVALVVAGGVGAVAADLPDRAENQFHRFTRKGEVSQSGSLRARLTDPGNNGRFEFWDVSLQQFRSARVRGAGAGTYSLAWAQKRPITTSVQDGHSLYLETLGELGIVGLVLIASVVILLLVGVVRRRGTDRRLVAVIFAVLLAWALHAGVEWDWEMPVLTLPVLCLAAAALAVPRADGSRIRRLPPIGRLSAALAVVLIAVTPALVAVSQMRLDGSVEALKRGDCEETVDSALGSIAALSMRPEPYELLAYCDSRFGEHKLANRQAEEAVRREPDNWNFWYSLALMRAAAGRDPRLSAARSLRLNRLGVLPRDAAKRFDTGSPREWRRRSQTAPLPLG